MTRLLSIFSFETLKVRPTLPRAVLVALLVVAAAEGAVRYRRAQKQSNFGHSFVWLVHAYEDSTQAGSADTWLLGNSTLAAGIDEARFESIAGIESVKMPHGFCNAEGYRALLEHYLDSAPAPERLVLFISKDDLTNGGLRSDSSAAYLRYVEESGLRPSHWLTLSFDRKELRQAAADEIDGAYSALRGQETAKSKRFDIDTVDAAVFAPDGPLDDVVNLRESLRDWSYDEESLRAMVKAARDKGVQEVGFVLLPCTDALADLHDRHVTGLTYEQVRARTRALCEQMDVRCLDVAVASGRYELFYDAFHANATGRRVLTRVVGEWVAQGMPAREPMTAAGYAALADRVLAESSADQPKQVATASGR